MGSQMLLVKGGKVMMEDVSNIFLCVCPYELTQLESCLFLAGKNETDIISFERITHHLVI